MLKEKFIKWLSRPTSSRSSTDVNSLPLSLLTDVGLQRDQNQDRVVAMKVNALSSANKSFLVLALVDGMGGMKNGSECATVGLATFLNATIRYRNMPPDERLHAATSLANTEVNLMAGGRGGATISAVLVTAGLGVYSVNVGDSRIYGCLQNQNAEQKMERLTVDDSLEEAVGGTGTELLQFLGMGAGIQPHVKRLAPEIRRILISSDGIHFVNQESLADVLLNSELTSEAVVRLNTLARWRGAPDNATLAVADLAPVQHWLDVSDETGVEVWDPFGALHIMWVKNDVNDISTSSPPGELERNIESQEGFEEYPGSIERPRRKRKPKIKSVSHVDQRKQEAHQLSIDISTGIDAFKVDDENDKDPI